LPQLLNNPLRTGFTSLQSQVVRGTMYHINYVGKNYRASIKGVCFQDTITLTEANYQAL